MLRRLVAGTRGSYEAALLVSTRSVEWLLDRLFRAMGRWVPEDIFISYARADASRYAMGLAAELASHNRNCITDVFAAEAGRQIPPGLRRALRRARQLVVLGTQGAIGSEGIAWEVQNFPRDGRSVVIIGFCDAVKDAPWFLQGFDPQLESSGRLATGEPSPDIVRTILEAYKFKTQQQRLAIFAVGILLFVVVAGAAIASYYTSVARLADERRKTAEAQLTATTRLLESKQKDLAATTEKMESARKDLADTTQRLEGTRTDLQLTDARRTVLDIAARRRALGYTPIEHVLRALAASRELMDRGFPVEAEVAVRENVELIPRFKTRFRIDPKGPMMLAGNPLRLFAASGKNVEVWDPLKGVRVGSPLAHEDAVSSLQFAGADKWLLITTKDQAVTLWDVASSTQRHRGACPGKVRSSTLSQDGRFLAIACDDVVEVTDVNSSGPAKPLWRLPPESSAPNLLAAQFPRAEGLLLLLSGDDSNLSHTLTAYELVAGKEPRRLDVDMSCLGGRNRWAYFSEDGGAILTTRGYTMGGNDVRVCSNIRLEPGKNSLAFHFIDLEHTSEVWRTDLSGMGPRVVTLGADYSAQIWNGLGKVVREFAPLGEWAERSSGGLFFSHDGVHVLLPRGDKQQWLVNSVSGDLVSVLPWPERTSDFDFNKHLVLIVTEGDVQVWEAQPFRTPEFYTGIPHDRIVPLDSAQAFVGSQTYAQGRAVQSFVWKIPSGERDLSCQKLMGAFRCLPDAELTAGSTYIDLAYQPGAGWVGLERSSNEYRAWRLRPRRELHRWTGDGEYTLTADGTFAVSADGRLRVVDLLARRELRSVEADRKRVVQVLRSPAGPLLAVRADGCSVRLVGLESGELRATIDTCATSLAVSSDGRFVVVGGDNQVGVWDLDSTRWVARRSVPHKVVAVAMSWNQQYVAVSTRVDFNDRVTLWRWQWADVREDLCRTLEQNLKTDQWTKLVDRRELARACAASRR